MKSQVEQLKQEITDYEKELKKLQGELLVVSRNSTPTHANSPSGIAEAIRAASVETHQRVADVQGLRDAIATLQAGLGQKQQHLADLEKEQQRQERLKRIEIGKAKVWAVGEEINALGAQLQAKFLELKAIANHYESDHRVLNSRPEAAVYWRPPEFVQFHQTVIPEFVENRGLFVLGAHSIDLFAAEQQAARLAEAQKFSAITREAEAAVRKQQEQENATHAAAERERLNSVLKMKREELLIAESTRQSWRREGGNMNFEKIDVLIGRLETEIREAEADLAALVKDAA